MISIVIALVVAAAPVKPGFWEWFAKNEARLADAAKKDPVPVMTEIQEQLDRAEPETDLVVELSLIDKPGLVISADGNSAQFGDVKRVAAAAPKLKRWQVFAFRQRRAWVADLEIEGKKFSIGDFSFRELGRAAGKIDLEVAIKGRTDANAKEVDNAAFLVLDTVLGEYDTETKIGVIDFVGGPKKSHRPIGELPAVVDKIQ